VMFLLAAFNMTVFITGVLFPRMMASVYSMFIVGRLTRELVHFCVFASETSCHPDCCTSTRAPSFTNSLRDCRSAQPPGRHKCLNAAF
jgi:hypothetical protein